MRRLLLALLLVLFPLAADGQQGATVNPVPGSVWTYLGPTIGADWVAAPGTTYQGPGRVSGVTCDGVADVTAALQAELDSFSGVGGGMYYLKSPGSKCVVGTTADLVLPNNVQLICGEQGGGFYPNGGYAAVADFLIDPSHSIKAGSVPGGRSGIFGCVMVRKGFTNATTLRTAITAANAFAGTAFVCVPNGTDVSVRESLFIGFALAAQSSCDRLKFVGNKGDATSFLSVLVCNDICEIHDDHAWGFVGNPYQTFPQFQVTTVTSATISGGTTLTLGFTAPPTSFVTGDTVVLAKVGGITGAQYGRFTATVVDGTHISVPGTFSGAFTSGGTIYLTSMRRTGTAFNFATGAGGGPMLRHLTNYGHDIGLHYAGGSSIQCNGCWLDNHTDVANLDPVPVGLLLDGTSGLINSFQGYINYNAVAIRKDDLSIFTIGPGTQLASFSSSVGRYVVEAIRGAIDFSSVELFTDFGIGGNAGIYMADAVTGLLVNGGVLNGTATFQTTSIGCPKFFNNGSAGPCVYTPTYTGATIAGPPDQAMWWRDPKGKTTIFYQDSGKAVSAKTGAQFSVSLPTTAAVGGSCALGNFVATLTASYYQHIANIVSGASAAVFVQIGSLTNLALPGTALGATDSLSMTCTYQ